MFWHPICAVLPEAFHFFCVLLLKGIGAVTSRHFETIGDFHGSRDQRQDFRTIHGPYFVHNGKRKVSMYKNKDEHPTTRQKQFCLSWSMQSRGAGQRVHHLKFHESVVDHRIKLTKIGLLPRIVRGFPQSLSNVNTENQALFVQSTWHLLLKNTKVQWRILWFLKKFKKKRKNTDTCTSHSRPKFTVLFTNNRVSFVLEIWLEFVRRVKVERNVTHQFYKVLCLQVLSQGW